MIGTTVFSTLTKLRHEISRSRDIVDSANKTSLAQEKQYQELDDKIDVEKERRLQQLPLIRKAVVSNFVDNLKEIDTKDDVQENNVIKYRRVAVQRFIRNAERTKWLV